MVGATVLKEVIMRSILAAVCFLFLATEAHAQTDLTTTAENATIRELRDPSSARFLVVQVRRISTRSGPADVVCGSISARNGFGGMSAASDFAYDPGDGRVVLTDPSIALNAPMAQLGARVLFRVFCE